MIYLNFIEKYLLEQQVHFYVIIVLNLHFQFCEWISSLSHTAAPLISLLLDYVGNVRLCCRITEQLKRTNEWAAIKEIACE